MRHDSTFVTTIARQTSTELIESKKKLKRTLLAKLHLELKYWHIWTNFFILLIYYIYYPETFNVESAPQPLSSSQFSPQHNYNITFTEAYLRMILLLLAKTTGLCMYVTLILIIFSKCYFFRWKLNSLHISEWINIPASDAVHYRFGTNLLHLAVIHTLSHIARMLLNGSLRFQTIQESFFLWPLLCGWIGFFSILALCLPFKINRLRDYLDYEFIKLCHTGCVILFLLCSIFHYIRLRYLCSFLLCTYLVDKLLGYTLRTYFVTTPYFFPIANGTMIEFIPPQGFEVKAGSYIYINIPWISKIEWHPFSVIPSAADIEEIVNFSGHQQGSLRCSIYIENSGNWTKRLQELAYNNIHRPIWINGYHNAPFGNCCNRDYIFIVCTGVGITPGVGVISKYSQYKTIVLIWACRDVELIDAYKPELCAVNAKIFNTSKQIDVMNGKTINSACETHEGKAIFYCGKRPNFLEEIKSTIIQGLPFNGVVPFNTNSNVFDKSKLDTGNDDDNNTDNEDNPNFLMQKFQSSKNEESIYGKSIKALTVSKASPIRTLRTAERSSRPLKTDEASSYLAKDNNNTILRKSMMDQFEIVRKQDVQPSEWLVLYCGNSSVVGDVLGKYCKARGISFQKEFFK